jgi:hypothetical protein
MSTALVLARPERRRILRELLNASEPWTVDQRDLYRDMVRFEWMDTADVDIERDLAGVTSSRCSVP